jgi:hypothetical protein
MESIDRGTKEKLKVRLFKALLFISVAIPSFTFAEQLSDSVFIEEMTWTEVRDAIKAGKTTIIFPTGGTEQNGPHMVLGKHNFIVKYTANADCTKTWECACGTCPCLCPRVIPYVLSWYD